MGDASKSQLRPNLANRTCPRPLDTQGRAGRQADLGKNR
jgi:hypothetical protein